ncbi:MAG TPA: hypothetical protein VNM14_19400 [Planctomycetota bacterium]|nr:hypothetical protein [Planctomycetota bacterium]
MAKSSPVTMLVSYYPKPGKEKALLALVRKHWPTLRRVKLASQMAPKIWRARDVRQKESYFVELFQWKDEKAAGIAHQTPEVMAIWESMGPILRKLQLTQIEAAR